MDNGSRAYNHISRQTLLEEVKSLRGRLEEAEATLHAIRHGEVDALMVSGPNGAQVYTLESAEQPYRVLIEQMQEGAVTLSQEGAILYCNLRFAQMLRMPHEKLLASSIQSLVIASQAAEFAALLDNGQTGSARAEITLRAGNGTLLPTYMTISALPAEVEGFFCMVVTDLTEQESLRRNQAEIEGLNQHLRRAMTETHHRVKNNLQLISALIETQKPLHGEMIPVSELDRLGKNVLALGVIHELLTHEAKMDGLGDMLSVKDVLERLLPMLQGTLAGRTLRFHLSEVRLPSRQATSLALITNELISNAVKHGNADVEVTLCIVESAATLEVCDDGAGFPAGFNSVQAANTGLELVNNISRWDLAGDISYQNRRTGGACVRLCFPIPSQ